MPGESISFSITADDRASGKFRDVGRSALDASAKIDVAAASLKLWDDTSARSSKATDTLIKSKLAVSKADAALAKAETFVSGEAEKATRLLSGQSRTFDDVAKKAETAAGGVSGLAGTGTLAGGGMGALIAAGVALSPVIVTVGAGLAGLAAAAYGIAKPIQAAAQATGGLQANMASLNPEQQTVARGLLALGKTFAGFQHALQPVVLGDFSQGLKLAGTLLHAIEPVAAATGKALGGVIGEINANFQAGEWQQFFAFMARTAGPDVQLLGRNFIDLANTLPPLLEQLQPVATELLQSTDAVIKLAGGIARLTGEAQKVAHLLPGYIQTELFFPGAKALSKILDDLGITGGQAAKGVAEVVTPAQLAARNLQAMATATTNLMTAQQKALSAQTTYGSDLVTTANDAAALEKALDGTRGKIGLQTAAQRNSFAAANTYITDLGNTAQAAYDSGHGVDASITAIRRGLPILDQAKTKNQQYWQEVKTLHDWLVKLESLKTIQEQVNVHGTGAWTVTPTGKHIPIPGVAAAGALVSGGTPGKDSVPIMAMPGELVVPTNMVNAGAVDHLRGQIPGFAAGGLVPSYSGNVAGLAPWSRGDLNATIHIFEAATAAATFAAMKAAARAAASFGAGVPGPGGGAPAANAALARRMMPAWGSGAEWAAWNYVAMRESGWNQYARNPSSGAYGIPQALPPSKMGAAANPPQSNPAAQISWMIGYIRGRYGDPIGAAAHERAFNWYDRGGLLPPGLSLAYNGTGRPEMVLPNRGGAAAQVVIEVRGNDSETSQFLVRLLKRHVRTAGGGSVQAAFATSR